MGRWDGEKLAALKGVFNAMSQVAEERESRTETQVALRFAMAKGCIPLPGVNCPEQAHEVVATLDWELQLDEIEALDKQAVALHVRRRDLPWLRGL